MCIKNGTVLKPCIQSLLYSPEVLREGYCLFCQNIQNNGSTALYPPDFCVCSLGHIAPALAHGFGHVAPPFCTLLHQRSLVRLLEEEKCEQSHVHIV